MPLHEKYESNLDEAKRFEDYASLKLYQHGIMIYVHASRNYQVRYGESRAGFEIKYDGNRQKTGNLFIETAEKHHEDADWKPSGIRANDGSWLYLIGDYHKIWVFACRTLCLIEKRYSARETATARGYLLPVSDADKYAAKVIDESDQPNGLDWLRRAWGNATIQERNAFLKEVENVPTS